MSPKSLIVRIHRRDNSQLLNYENTSKMYRQGVEVSKVAQIAEAKECDCHLLLPNETKALIMLNKRPNRPPKASLPITPSRTSIVNHPFKRT